MNDKIREEIVKVLRRCIKVDVTGLAPAVAAHHIVGFEEAADAIALLVKAAEEEWLPIKSAGDPHRL